MKKKSKILNHVKVKLFFVKAKKRKISYKLNLPKNAKIYFIFYILILKLRDLKTLI